MILAERHEGLLVCLRFGVVEGPEQLSDSNILVIWGRVYLSVQYDNSSPLKMRSVFLGVTEIIGRARTKVARI